MNLEQLSETIRNVIGDELAPARIVHVRVTEDVDHEGDDILRVDVVVDVEGSRLDPAKVIGLVRHLRGPLAEIHEKRFPLLNFMKHGDVDGAAA